MPDNVGCCFHFLFIIGQHFLVTHPRPDTHSFAREYSIRLYGMDASSDETGGKLQEMSYLFTTQSWKPTSRAGEIWNPFSIRTFCLCLKIAVFKYYRVKLATVRPPPQEKADEIVVNWIDALYIIKKGESFLTRWKSNGVEMNLTELSSPHGPGFLYIFFVGYSVTRRKRQSLSLSREDVVKEKRLQDPVKRWSAFWTPVSLPLSGEWETMICPFLTSCAWPTFGTPITLRQSTLVITCFGKVRDPFLWLIDEFLFATQSPSDQCKSRQGRRQKELYYYRRWK